MKATITIDIRKRDDWGKVDIELNNTRRYLSKNIDANEMQDNNKIIAAIRSIICRYIDKEIPKEFKEEDSWYGECQKHKTLKGYKWMYKEEYEKMVRGES